MLSTYIIIIKQKLQKKKKKDNLTREYYIWQNLIQQTKLALILIKYVIYLYANKMNILTIG